MQDGCVLWVVLVIAPQKGKKMLLTLLPHPGISSLKGLAWSYVWWPQMDQDVEREIN